MKKCLMCDGNIDQIIRQCAQCLSYNCHDYNGGIGFGIGGRFICIDIGPFRIQGNYNRVRITKHHAYTKILEGVNIKLLRKITEPILESLWHVSDQEAATRFEKAHSFL